jgi:serine/threonine-protein phosphatase 6 regulatory ankyrin repeat subunit B
VNIQNNIGDTALIVASYQGYYKIVKLLINNKADPNIQNYRRDTALIWASTFFHDDIVYLLLNSGADPNIENINSNTSLICALDDINTDYYNELIYKKYDIRHRYVHEKILCIEDEQMINNYYSDFKIDTSNSNYRYFDENKCYKTVKHLINNGADINVYDNYNRTPLHIATERRFDNIVELLIKHGYDPTILDEDIEWNEHNETPLINAVHSNNYKLAFLLISLGVNINIIGPDHCTALIMANDYGYYNIFKLLINHGAIYNINDIIDSPMIDYTIRIDRFKNNMRLLTGIDPLKYFFINNVILIKLLSKSKTIYLNTYIPKSILWLIGSYFFY